MRDNQTLFVDEDSGFISYYQDGKVIELEEPDVLAIIQRLEAQIEHLERELALRGPMTVTITDSSRVKGTEPTIADSRPNAPDSKPMLAYDDE